MKIHKKASIFLGLLLVSLFCQVITAQEYIVVSPDNSIQLKISVDDKITYSVVVDDQLIMDSSSLSLTLSEKNILGSTPKVIKEERKVIDQTLFPQLRVKSKEIKDHCNEMILAFKGSYKIHFRAYDNGVAYRFETNFKEKIHIQSEEAKFNFIPSTKVYFPREKEFFSHNERLYEFNGLDTLSAKDLCSLPILVKPSEKVKVLITETGLMDYPGMWLTGGEKNSLQATFPAYALEVKTDSSRWKDDRSIRVSKEAEYIAKVEGNRTYPWRIACIAKKDVDLISNQLTYLLAESSKIENTSWIKPGKVAWDWWNFNNIYGVDFEAGVNTETYKYYIDFAAQYGIEYIILDEGWYTLGNVLDVVPEMDVKELINYGKSKNVGVILWVTWSSLDQKLQEGLDTFKEWGAKGVKVDFMQRDDQWMVKYYERIAEACAKRELLVNFHGSFKPSGLRRMYPNVLTREGVKGAENNKWASYITPTHNLTLPFIRMVAGPMDYTPGAMVNAQEENFAISWKRPMSMGTRSHQVAMYILYESPLQMLCDSPSNYAKENDTTEFIAKIPTVWDETKVLSGEIGEYLAIARKNENQWYVGAMTNEKERSFDIDLSFLEEGTYKIEIFQDGVNAERYASDYKRITKQVTNKDSIEVKLASGGGWATIITPME